MLALYFEAGRAVAELADCVMYNPFPDLSYEAENFIRKTVENFTVKSLSERLNTIYELIEKTEKIIETDISKNFSSFNIFDSKLIVKPFFFLTNRIISKGAITISPELQFYIGLENNKDKIEKSLKKLRKAEIKVIKARKPEKLSKINEIEGKMLGYPECCVENFSKLKRLRNIGVKVRSPEGKVADELLNMLKTRYELDKIVSGMRVPEEFYVFFTFNFYPCSIKCKKAKKIGLNYKNFFEKVGKPEIFDAGVIASVVSTSKICVKIGKMKGKYYHYLSFEEIMQEYIKNRYKNCATK